MRAVVADVQRRYSVDPQRVYATGMSNGGMLAHRLACEAADVFAGIAAVAGTDVAAMAALQACPLLKAAPADDPWPATLDWLQRECLRLEEVLQGERRDKLLLQRALDLARANRRALQDQLLDRPRGVSMAIQPPVTRIAPSLLLGTAAPPASAAAETPPSLTLGEDVPPPSSPALTEHLHAACR